MSRISSSISSVLFNSVYHTFLSLAFCVLAIRWVFQKRIKGRDFSYFAARFGAHIPVLPKTDDLIWIHAPSLGETRAALFFIRLLKKKKPEAQIVLSTTTLAGLAEGQKQLPELNAHFLLPLDFSWIMRKCVRRLSPKMLILVEGDLWYQLISAVKDAGGKSVLINGKVSEKSQKRYRLFPLFTRKLFDKMAFLCVQSKRYQERFKAMGVPDEKIAVTGNLKFDASFSELSLSEKAIWQEKLKITPEDLVVVIGSTHPKEEEELLSAIEPLFEKLKKLKVLLVPRRSERFDEVFSLLQKLSFPVGRYSRGLQGNERVILIDAMGVLTQCYQLGAVAIVAGSFSSHVGGHNILEPVLLGIPVLFGPSMHTQMDMKELVLQAGAGASVEAQNLAQVLLSLLQDPQKQLQYKQSALHLKKEIQGSSERTLDILMQ